MIHFKNNMVTAASVLARRWRLDLNFGTTFVNGMAVFIENALNKKNDTARGFQNVKIKHNFIC